MKKIIVLIATFITTHTILPCQEYKKTSSIDRLKQLSPKRKVRVHDTDVSPHLTVLQELFKAETTAAMLLITDRAKKNHNITALEIAHFALAQEKHEDIHKFYFIQMVRIASYNQKIADEKKLCPAITLYNNLDIVMARYMKCGEAREENKRRGLSISYAQQYGAAFGPIEIIPNLAFEDYIRLETDLYKLSMKPAYWNETVAMMTIEQKNIASLPSYVALDDNNQ